MKSGREGASQGGLLTLPTNTKKVRKIPEELRRLQEVKAACVKEDMPIINMY